MQAGAAAIIELARDPRYVGGTVAVLAVLHTWTQQLNLHPHVHCLVSGGGISEDASTWHPARRNFLKCPIKALDKLVRGKFRDLLRRKCPNLVISDAVWSKRWILHVTAWGDGEQAVLEYSPAMSFASLSPTPASSASTTKRSPSSTGTQDRPPANLPSQRRRVHAPLPPACVATRVPQGPLLRAVASPATPHSRPGAADVATPGTTEARPVVGFRCSSARGSRC